MSLESQAIRILEEWYAGLKRYQDNLPAKGSITAALHVLSRIRKNYDLDITSHVATGEAQITGLSGASLKKILAEFGETRPLSSVGGRTNRGARGNIAALLTAMGALRLEAQPEVVRQNVLKAI